MQQTELWHDCVEDALRAVVVALGGSKRVGSELWPAKPVADAARLLNHCLDPERPEKLELSQVVWLLAHGRQAQCHVGMEFIAEAAGYQATPVDPETERDRLQREFIESVRASQRIAERLEGLGSRVADIRKAS